MLTPATAPQQKDSDVIGPFSLEPLSVATLIKGLIVPHFNLKNRAQELRAEAERILTSLVTADPDARSWVEVWAGHSTSQSVPIATARSNQARAVLATTSSVQESIDPALIKTLLADAHKTLLSFDPSLAFDKGVRDTDDYVDGLITLLLLADENAPLRKAVSYLLRTQLNDFAGTPAATEALAHSGVKSSLMVLGIDPGKLPLDSSEVGVREVFLDNIGFLRRGILFDKDIGVALLRQEAHLFRLLIESAVEHGTTVREAAIRAERTAPSRRTESGVVLQDNSMPSWLGAVSPMLSPISGEGRIPESLRPLLHTGGKTPQDIASGFDSVKARNTLLLLDQLLGNGIFLERVKRDTLERITAISTANSAREKLRSWIEGPDQFLKKVAIHVRATSGTLESTVPVQAPLVQTESNQTGISRAVVSPTTGDELRTGVRPRANTPSGLLISIEEQTLLAKENSIYSQQLLALKKHVTNLELPAEDFLPKLLSLQEALIKSSSVAAEGSSLVVQQTIRNLIANAPSNIPRLTVSGENVKLSFQLDQTAPIMLPGDVISANGIIAALKLISGFRTSGLSSSAHEVLLEQTALVLADPSDTKLELRTKLLGGSTEHTRETLALALLADTLETSRTDRQRTSFAAALFYIALGQQNLEKFLSNPAQISATMLSIESIGHDPRAKDRVATALEKFQSLVSLAQLQDSPEAAVLAAYRGLADRIRSNGFDAEIRRIVISLRGSLPTVRESMVERLVQHIPREIARPHPFAERNSGDTTQPSGAQGNGQLPSKSTVAAPVRIPFAASTPPAIIPQSPAVGTPLTAVAETRIVKLRALPLGALPNPESPEGCLLEFDSLAKDVQKNRFSPYKLRVLGERIGKGGKVSAIAGTLPSEQFVSRLFDLINEHTRPLSTEERSAFIDFGLPLVEFGRSGVPPLEEIRGVSPSGVPVYARKIQTQDGQRLSTDGLSSVAIELLRSIDEFADAQTAAAATPQEIKDAYLKSLRARTRIDLAGRLLIRASESRDFEGKFSEPRILPLDVVAAYVATLYLSTEDTSRSSRVSEIVIDSLVTLSLTRAEIGQEIMQLFRSDKAGRSALAQILSPFPAASEKKEQFAEFLRVQMLMRISRFGMTTNLSLPLRLIQATWNDRAGDKSLGLRTIAPRRLVGFDPMTQYHGASALFDPDYQLD